MEELNPLDRLNLEKARTLFVFYGYKKVGDGSPGGPYFKQAHSFAEAYGDLMENLAVESGLYIVKDIFVEVDESDAPTLHIELGELRELTQEDDE